MTDLDNLTYLLDQYDRLLAMHAMVVMDTPEENVIHARAIRSFTEIGATVRDHVNLRAKETT